MPIYVIYNKKSGQIVARTQTDDIAHYKIPEGFASTLGSAFGDSHYVKEDVITPKEPSRINMTQDGTSVVLRGVMQGAKVWWTGAVQGEKIQNELTGIMELSFPANSYITVFADQFPEKTFDANIKT